MRKFITVVVMFVGFLLLPNTSKADSITTTATYANGTSTTLFSAPGKTITLTFNLPSHLGSLTELNIPVSVSFMGHTFAESASVFIFPEENFGGLFDVVFLAGGHRYDWSLYGPQIFDANNNLTPGSFDVDRTQSEFLRDIGFGGFGTFSKGTVVVSSAAGVPEPTSLLLLGMGLFGLVPFARKSLGKKQGD